MGIGWMGIGWMVIRRWCGASCAEPSDRSARRLSRTSDTGRAGLRCASDNGGSARPIGQISIRNPSRRTGTASRPCGSADEPSGATIWCRFSSNRRASKRASTAACDPRISCRGAVSRRRPLDGSETSVGSALDADSAPDWNGHGPSMEAGFHRPGNPPDPVMTAGWWPASDWLLAAPDYFRAEWRSYLDPRGTALMTWRLRSGIPVRDWLVVTFGRDCTPRRQGPFLAVWWHLVALAAQQLPLLHQSLLDATGRAAAAAAAVDVVVVVAAAAAAAAAAAVVVVVVVDDDVDVVEAGWDLWMFWNAFQWSGKRRERCRLTVDPWHWADGVSWGTRQRRRPRTSRPSDPEVSPDRQNPHWRSFPAYRAPVAGCWTWNRHYPAGCRPSALRSGGRGRTALPADWPSPDERKTWSVDGGERARGSRHPWHRDRGGGWRPDRPSRRSRHRPHRQSLNNWRPSSCPHWRRGVTGLGPPRRRPPRGTPRLPCGTGRRAGGPRSHRCAARADTRSICWRIRLRWRAALAAPAGRRSWRPSSRPAIAVGTAK